MGLEVTIFGGGLIGSASAVALAAADHDVRVVTRAPASQAFDATRWLFGDMASFFHDRTLQGTDVVLYAAGSLMPASQIASVAGVLADQLIPVVELAERA